MRCCRNAVTETTSTDWNRLRLKRSLSPLTSQWTPTASAQVRNFVSSGSRNLGVANGEYSDGLCKGKNFFFDHSAYLKRGEIELRVSQYLKIFLQYLSGYNRTETA